MNVFSKKNHKPVIFFIFTLIAAIGFSQEIDSPDTIPNNYDSTFGVDLLNDDVYNGIVEVELGQLFLRGARPQQIIGPVTRSNGGTKKPENHDSNVSPSAEIITPSFYLNGTNSETAISPGRISILEDLLKSLDKINESNNYSNLPEELKNRIVESISKDLIEEIELRIIEKQQLALYRPLLFEHNKRLLEYYNANIDRNQSVLNGERLMTWTAFLVVHFLLLISVGIACVEFWRAGFSNRDTPLVVEEENGCEAFNDSASKSFSEIELSLHKMKVRSAQFGVLLIMFSLAFYFLYLKFVYTITSLPPN